MLETVMDSGVDRLERRCWAPWLRFAKEELAAQRQLYPDGQLEVREGSQVVAALSCTRTDWDGLSASLPTWDELAAPGNRFADRFAPNGNTLVTLSMSVDPAVRGRGCAADLLVMAIRLAEKSGVAWVTGDYRPSAYAEAKRAGEPFDEYCRRRRADGCLVDPWLRAIERAGFEFVRVDARAMVCDATVQQVDDWRRSYQPTEWYLVADESVRTSLIAQHLPHQAGVKPTEVWECGETGSWYVDRASGNAVYIESNMWGRYRVGPQVGGPKAASDKIKPGP